MGRREGTEKVTSVWLIHFAPCSKLLSNSQEELDIYTSVVGEIQLWAIAILTLLVLYNAVGTVQNS